VKLFYRKYGSGPPLIILHALYGSSDNWVQIAKSVSDHFTCYLPDLRNHGRSPHSSEHNYMVMSDDLGELASELNLERFFLAGHSMGGKIAVHYSMRQPEKLGGLLVADISPFVTESHNRAAHKQHSIILRTIIDTDLSRFSNRNEVESALSESIESEKVRGFIMKNLQRSADGTFAWRLNAGALLNNLSNIMEGIGRPDDDRYAVTGFPVLFLKGERSDYLPGSDLPDIQKIFPAAELISISNAGHWIQADRPDEVKAGLLRLLG